MQRIVEECGIKTDRFQPVHGGDINRAFCIDSEQGKFFLKLNSSSEYPGMFEKEAKGLNELKQNSLIKIPGVIKNGTVDNCQYLLLQWIEKRMAKNDCMEKFGNDLAKMHQQPQSFFGWNEDNYIGSLQQQNNKRQDWPSFYSECRILPLSKLLIDQGLFDKKESDNAEVLCKRLKNLFPEEPPALLHGDLWSGNYMIGKDGYVVMYDPAVYFGHREMDIGMSRLFGGFGEQFFEAYHHAYPLQKGWEDRLPLTQLYPLLIHAVLFGGHYIQTARGILARYS